MHNASDLANAITEQLPKDVPGKNSLLLSQRLFFSTNFCHNDEPRRRAPAGSGFCAGFSLAPADETRRKSSLRFRSPYYSTPVHLHICWLIDWLIHIYIYHIYPSTFTYLLIDWLIYIYILIVMDTFVSTKSTWKGQFDCSRVVAEIVAPEMRTRGDAKNLKKHDDYSESTDSKSADKMLDVARFSHVEARNVRDIMHALRLQIPCNQKVNLQVDRVAWAIMILMPNSSVRSDNEVDTEPREFVLSLRGGSENWKLSSRTYYHPTPQNSIFFGEFFRVIDIIYTSSTRYSLITLLQFVVCVKYYYKVVKSTDRVAARKTQWQVPVIYPSDRCKHAVHLSILHWCSFHGAVKENVTAQKSSHDSISSLNMM